MSVDKIESQTQGLRVDRRIDAQGLACPLPLLKLKAALYACGSGEIVHLVTQDPGAKRDVPLYVARDPNAELLLQVTQGQTTQVQTYQFWVKRL